VAMGVVLGLENPRDLSRPGQAVEVECGVFV
jgi:hypothetical protein